MPIYKKIHFADHCRIRQDERVVTNQQIIEVLKEPTNEAAAKRIGRRKFWKNIDGTKLIVLLKEVKNGKEAIIITTYWRD